MKDDFEFLRGLANCQDKEQMARYIEEHQPKPMTNADRIRAMTDAELAGAMFAGIECGACPCSDKCRKGSFCSDTILKWLKQPAGVSE